MSLDEMPEKELRRAEMALTVRNTRVTFAQDHHSNTRGERLNFSAYPHIAEMYNTLAYHLVVQGSVQSFKGQALYSFVHTPSGWVTMGSLKVGDVVSTPDGKGAKVAQIQPLGVRRLCKFTLDDGRTVESDFDHLWKVREKGASWEVLSTAEIEHRLGAYVSAYELPLLEPVPYFEPTRPRLSLGSLETVEQRVQFVRECVDTKRPPFADGTVLAISPEAELLKEVVWSLGGYAKLRRKHDSFSVLVNLPKFGMGIERFPQIVKCEAAGEDECQCIVLDNEEHLYIMDNYVVTHNSEMLIVDHLAMAYSGLSVFYVIPKYEARVTYVQNRINRCVERVPFYKDIVGEGFFDSVAIKSFGKGVIKYVSSNVKADFREYPADVAFVEEVDECNTENLALVQDRLRASPFQFTRWVGNPKNPNEGINKHYLDSDRREWHVPCYACGKYSQLDWFKTIVKPVTGDGGSVVDYRLKDTEWTPSIGRDIYPICPCGGRLERASSKGIWRPTNPISTPVVGYHTSMLVSLLNDISGMYVRFKKALVDPVLLKAFYNSELGLPFSAAGSKVTYELLDSCRQVGYNMAITESSGHSQEGSHPGPCSMGVDVGHAFDVRISYLTGSKNRVALFIGKVKSTSELYDLMARYNVRVAVFDAEPEAHLVREIQANAASTEVWMCKYKQQEGSTGSIQYNHDDRMLSIDRTEALDKSFAAFKQRKNRIPENYRVILDGEYGEELCMPVREAIMDAKERRRYVWTKGKDHSRHADTYDLLASEMLNESGFEVSIG